MYSGCTAPLAKLISKVHRDRFSWGLDTAMDTAVAPDQINDTEALGTQRTLRDLVLGAQGGDAQAWQQIIGRFTPLVISISRAYRLSFDDGQDVGQAVWLKLYENIS